MRNVNISTTIFGVFHQCTCILAQGTVIMEYYSFSCINVLARISDRLFRRKQPKKNSKGNEISKPKNLRRSKKRLVESFKKGKSSTHIIIELVFRLISRKTKTKRDDLSPSVPMKCTTIQAYCTKLIEKL